MDFKDYLEQTNIKYEVTGDNLTVGGGLYLEGTNISSLPDNLTVGGGLYLEDTNINSLPDNLTVGGGLDLRNTNINSLPDNLTVGGGLYLEGTNISSLPDNLTVGGGLYLEDTNINSLPDNLTVGGGLDLRNTNINSLPDNLTVGGGLYLRDTNINKNKKCKIKKLQNDFYIKHKNYIMSKLSWQNGKYRKIDGIFCEVIKQNKNILTVKIENRKAYIFAKNGIYAHGNTVKQAYFDWLFKTSDRDTSRYKHLKLNSKNSLEFWVIAYRTITGACSFGTNNYLENNKDKYKSEMTLEEVFKATEGQYGSSTFKAFFQNN